MNKWKGLDKKLCCAAAKSCELREFSCLPDDSELKGAHEFSASFHQSIIALADPLDRPGGLSRRARIIILVAALIALIAAAAMGAAAVHDAVWEMKVNSYEDHAVVSFNTEKQAEDAMPAPERIGQVYDIPIPDGFMLTEREASFLSCHLSLESDEVNESGRKHTIIFSQHLMSSWFYINTEDVEISFSEINGIECQCRVRNNWSCVTWVQCGYVFMIESNSLNTQELIALAERLCVDQELTELIAGSDLVYHEDSDGRTLVDLMTDEIINID